MSPDRSHLCMPLGRSLDLTATLDAVGAAVPEPPIGPHATTINSSAIAGAEKRMRPTLRDELRGASHLKEDRLAVLGTRRAPAFDRVWQHANGLDMPYDLQAATSEYIGWLQLEANGITLPKLEQRLPKPIDPDELTRLLAALPSSTVGEKRDRALVQFLISTGCRISEALALDRTDFPRSGNRLIVTGKGSKQRA